MSPLLVGAPEKARRVVPFSGGLLMGISLFGVLPELAEQYQWTRALGMLLVGIALLWLVGKYVYPVCPSCSHTHDHEMCSVRLHGFALPLVVTAMLHSFLDGVGIAASQHDHSVSGSVLAAGVILHKIPEGVALGVILAAAMKSRKSALAWCAAIQSFTLVGALLDDLLAARLGDAWVSYALAAAGGSFIYLGFHAVHGEWKRRGPVPAFMPAITGIAGAAALYQGLHAAIH